MTAFQSTKINWPLIPVIILIAAGMLWLSVKRLSFEADIVQSLPATDPVVSAAREVLAHHPVQDRLVIDLHSPAGDLDLLVTAAELVEGRMVASGLFAVVGLGDLQDLMPTLVNHVVAQLPVLFEETALTTMVAPRLAPAWIDRRLRQMLENLQQLDGLGQMRLMRSDPLGLRELVLKRLTPLSPAPGALPYQGRLLSADRRHLLIVATPAGSATDTGFARQAAALFDDIAAELGAYEAAARIVMTPMGAYRAALDNERFAKGDIQRAVGLATLGIALMLLFAFPRPYLGLLSLVPAAVGTVMALFAFSLVHDTIFLITLGFGGAIISITVDHGIAYMLFMDRPTVSIGHEAAREVRAVGLLAALTTICAFSSLSLSGFAIMSEIGQFASLGIGFSFLSVHLLMPRLLPTIGPATRSHPLPLQRWVDWLGQGKRPLAWAAIAIGAVALFFASPRFAVDLRAMNTVSADTRQAEETIRQVWGDVAARIHLIAADDTLEALRARAGQLTAELERQVQADVLQPVMTPAALFPDPVLQRDNHDAWRRFWHPDRVQNLRRDLGLQAQKIGFTKDTFDPFFESIARKRSPDAIKIPAAMYDLLGIVPPPEGASAEEKWRLYLSLSPGPQYAAGPFFERIEGAGLGHVFDPAYFSKRLGRFLSDTFLRMALIITAAAAVLTLVFLRNLRLSLLALCPLAFGFICTLAVLGLSGQSLGIAGLMIAIVVIGMGIDYALFFIRAYQRYGDGTHPYVRLARLAVLMAATSTLIGFGSLSLADHTLLRGAGVTSFWGILFVLIGTFLILPPFLRGRKK